MNEIFLLYLWTRLDAIHDVAQFIGSATIVLLIFSPIGLVIILDDMSQVKALWNKAKWYLVPVWVLATVITVLVPTKQDAAIIAGGWVALEAVQSDVAKNIGSKTLTLIEDKLNEEIKNIEKRKAK